jgi:hypothetical protein
MQDMEKITPHWQPNEKECLAAILEPLIDEGVVAVRQKLGYSALCQVDTDFWTNIGIDAGRLLRTPDLMEMLTDFLPYFWLSDRDSWSCLALSEEFLDSVLRELLKVLELHWHDEGTLVLVDMVTPQMAHLIKTRRERIQRVITLVGPSLFHACTAWGLQPEQYKALISRDTLEVLDPHVRWNMIYGSEAI